MEVKKDGFSTDGKELTFKDGNREVFTARLIPDEPHMAKADAPPEKSPPPTDTKKPDPTPVAGAADKAEIANVTQELLNHSWFYYDNLFPPGDPCRFNADGTFHVYRWQYWVVGPRTFRVHYDRNTHNKETGFLFTFNQELTKFTAEFTDPNGKVHKITGTRQ